MNLAGKSAELPSGFRRVNELLANWRPVDHQPDLRGWEFYYLDCALPSRPRHPARAFRLGRLGRAGARTGPGSPRPAPIRRSGSGSAGTGRQVLTLRGHAGPGLGGGLEPRRRAARLRRRRRDDQGPGGGDGPGVLHPARARGAASGRWPGAPTASRLASAGDDGTVRVWDAGAGNGGAHPDAARRGGPGGGVEPRRVATRLRRRRRARSASGTPDGEGGARPARARRAGRVAGVEPRRRAPRLGELGLVGQGLVDRTAAEEALTLRGHTSLVASVAWSPDGSRLASAGEDGTIRVWDAGDGSRGVHPARAHRAGQLGELGSGRDAAGLGELGRDDQGLVGGSRPGAPALGRRPSPGAVRGASPRRGAPTGRAWPRSPGTGPSRSGRRIRPGDCSSCTSPRRPAGAGRWRGAPTARGSPRPATDATVRVWDARDGAGGVHACADTPGRSCRVAWSPDGTRLASGRRGRDGPGLGRRRRRRRSLALRGHSVGGRDGRLEPRREVGWPRGAGTGR